MSKPKEHILSPFALTKDHEIARSLPTETKRKFWKAFSVDMKTLGEARKLAGIKDAPVAIALIVQCYKTKLVPMEVDEIE